MAKTHLQWWQQWQQSVLPVLLLQVPVAVSGATSSRLFPPREGWGPGVELKDGVPEIPKRP
jgi:hypothetical protein